MIRIQRQYDTKGIPAGFRGVRRVAKQRLLLDVLHTGTTPDQLSFATSTWKPAKVSLKREAGGKCAYCEAPAAGRVSKETKNKGGLVAHCDVEHFRPKDLYWWLAHNFENYLHSCQVCNQSFKSNQFPAAVRLTAPFTVTGAETSAQLNAMADQMAPDPLNPTDRTAWEAVIAAENADLADPLHEDPEMLFKYHADSVVCEVSIKPRASFGRNHDRADATIKVLGLEREELRHARHDVYQTTNVLREVLADTGIKAATRTLVENELARLMAANQPFAGMVRYFVKQVWQLSILPASPS